MPNYWPAFPFNEEYKTTDLDLRLFDPIMKKSIEGRKWSHSVAPQSESAQSAPTLFSAHIHVLFCRKK
jgi:hypothetical protein